MPLLVDGVEINEVFIDGVEQDKIFVDGVEVYTGFTPENFLDDFQRSSNGTPTINHVMNTGQRWEVENVGTTAVIAAGQSNGAGHQVSLTQITGTTSRQRIKPLVEVINPSHITRASFTWNPVGITGLLAQGIIYLGDASGDGARVRGVAGEYQFILNYAGDQVDFTQGPIDQSGCSIVQYYDGVDIAAEITLFPSGSRHVFPRRSNGGIAITEASYFWGLGQPLLAGGIGVSQIFLVSQEYVPPDEMPWPT